jgi:putative spermidine/putrescine transport system permease protein
MPGFSLQWIREFLDSAVWQLALRNSLIVAFFATLLSSILGTLAALGLTRRDCPARATIMAVLISPMIVPVRRARQPSRPESAQPRVRLAAAFRPS